MVRSVDKPVGHIALSGYGVSRAAGVVHWYLEYEGPQVVFMDLDGRVFALPDGSALETQWTAHRSDWGVGYYKRCMDRRRMSFTEMRALIERDLRDRLRELQQARAA